MKKAILSKRFLHGVLLTLAFCLFPVLPAFAQGDIVDRLDKALGVTLPSEYKSKLKTFVQSSRIFKDKDASELTEQFIKDEMKKDWGISKQSQLLFIWTAINEKINGEYLYDGSDGNEKRLEEVDKVMETFEDCGKRYETAFRARMKEISAEAEQRSAEAEKRITDAQQRSAEAVQSTNAMTHYGLYQMISVYKHRHVATESEIKQMKEFGKHYIQNCEKFNIDYRTLLPLEVQKFYDIQPTKQNNLTCKQATAQILTCTLKELAKLYNLYQQAPKAERKIDKVNSIIDNCKENNLDYKAVLLKELGSKQKVEDLLKLFGAE